MQIVSKKVEDLVAGNRVDLQSCPFLKDHPSAETEFAVVTDVARETPDCVTVAYEGIDCVGYQVGTLLLVRAPKDVPEGLSAAMRQYVESQFGSDEALGVYYIGVDGSSYSLAEAEALFAKQGDSAPDMASSFPDGASATVCTNYAIQIGRRLPERTLIFGFANTDNPLSRVAREEIHPGGHDFAVIDDRFIVDPWVRLVAGVSEQICFDLEDEHDAAIALDFYGPREAWRRMREAEEQVECNPFALESYCDQVCGGGECGTGAVCQYGINPETRQPARPQAPDRGTPPPKVVLFERLSEG